ncbi:MAG: response regulator transcription factor [Candidatus Zipacnadales bacterium]
MKARILLVDDEPHLRDMITRKLTLEGYEVLATGSGAEALKLVAEAHPDLILLDIGLPDINGVSVCEEARQQTTAPILMLTGEVSPTVAVRALDLGATDYVRKPVDLNELVARIRAALRTAAAVQTPQRGPVKIGALTIDEDNGVVRYQDKDVEASPTEIRLLAHLARHPGRAFSRQELLRTLWDDERGEHLVEVHVSNLRRRLQAAGCPSRLIRTVPGRGYRLDPPPREAS